MTDVGNLERRPDAPRFEVRVTADSHMAWIRTRLALERTLMAWLRTAVSLIGFGFAIVQFFEHLQQEPGSRPGWLPHAPLYVGQALTACGVVALFISVSQYRTIVRYLRAEPFTPIAALKQDGMHSSAVGVAVLLILIGLFAFAAVLVRL